MALPMQQLQLTAVAAASGTATASLPTAVNYGTIVIGIVNVQTNGAACDATLLLNGLPVCATAAGNLDTASDWPPITVGPKDTFAVQWTGCANGDQCQAVLYYWNDEKPGKGIRAASPTPTWQDY